MRVGGKTPKSHYFITYCMLCIADKALNLLSIWQVIIFQGVISQYVLLQTEIFTEDDVSEFASEVLRSARSLPCFCRIPQSMPAFVTIQTSKL